MLDTLKQPRLAAVLVLTAAAAAAVLSGNALAVRERSEWTSLHHAKRGFYIAYPGDVFAPAEGAKSEDGVVLASRDGRAKLLVATFENTSDFSLSNYRDYLLKESYSGAKVDYERTRDRWFVISGTRKDTMFYERVTFTCGGKLVNSWVMLYPVAERASYDRIVEAVARTYMPGAGASGNCD
jgi:hypothetical protein